MGTHTPFVRCRDNYTTSKSFTMYKLFVIAAVLATAAAEGFYPAGYAGYGGLYPAGLAGLPYGAGYAGAYGAHGYARALAAPVVAAPAVVAPAPATYAVPAPRVVQEA